MATFTVREGQSLNFSPGGAWPLTNPALARRCRSGWKSSDPGKTRMRLVLETLALFGIGEPDQAIAKCKSYPSEAGLRVGAHGPGLVMSRAGPLRRRRWKPSKAI